jgi:hypothetical protein
MFKEDHARGKIGYFQILSGRPMKGNVKSISHPIDDGSIFSSLRHPAMLVTTTPPITRQYMFVSRLGFESASEQGK